MEPSIVKLEITDNLLISLSSDQTMCIWNRQTGVLMRDFQFLSATLLADRQQQRERTASSSTGARKTNTWLSNGSVGIAISNVLRPSRWLSSPKSHPTTSSHMSRSPASRNSVELQPPPPTMSLYSRSILITGGCSCIFLWNIWKGELIKKINIRKPLIHQQQQQQQQQRAENDERLALVNQIKEIRVIRQQVDAVKYSPRNKVNKLVLVTDYTDAVYVLKIPSNLTQTSFE